MDLKAIFAIIREKGYHYFNGGTNDRDNALYIDFSTGHNGRGDLVELELWFDKNHKIRYRNNDGKIIEKNNLNDPELMNELKNL